PSSSSVWDGTSQFAPWPPLVQQKGSTPPLGQLGAGLVGGGGGGLVGTAQFGPEPPLVQQYGGIPPAGHAGGGGGRVGGGGTSTVALLPPDRSVGELVVEAEDESEEGSTVGLHQRDSSVVELVEEVVAELVVVAAHSSWGHFLRWYSSTEALLRLGRLAVVSSVQRS
uniref:Uncharacterized protein n=1 Tax=Anopheles melas TaxID=34690 RepID=A0A182TPC2_9DIPT